MRRNTLALQGMLGWVVSQTEPDGRTALEHIVHEMTTRAMAGDFFFAKLVVDTMVPAGSKLLLASDLKEDDGGNATVVADRGFKQRFPHRRY